MSSIKTWVAVFVLTPRVYDALYLYGGIWQGATFQ